MIEGKDPDTVSRGLFKERKAEEFQRDLLAYLNKLKK